MARPVYVGGESTAFGSQFTYGAQGEYLEAAAVRQDRTVPGLELVESSGRPESAQSGTEIQMIGVAQDDLGPDIILQLLVIHSLDGTDGPDGHEDGSVDAAMVGGDGSAAGGTAGIAGSLDKFHLGFDF